MRGVGPRNLLLRRRPWRRRCVGCIAEVPQLHRIDDRRHAVAALAVVDTAGAEDYDKLTIAPRYSITDSLGAVIEFSDIDSGDEDANLFAVELTYTF